MTYTSLIEAISHAQSLLTSFVAAPQTPLLLTSIFGETIDTDAVLYWLQHSNHNLPNIEIRSASEINYANGAYSADTNTIYLAEEFLVTSAHDINAISTVFIEELGHYLDRQFNTTDGRGDEGELFAAAVTGLELSPEDIAKIKTEDDSVAIELDEQMITIEQANFGENNAFDLIGLTQLRNEFPGIDGSGLAVVVIDTGITSNHPLISPNYITGVDFVDLDNNPSDDNGHGTHVAGTVGAADETIGVAPEVDLIALDVFGVYNGNFGATILSQVQALQWVLDNHEEYDIVAVNMSLGAGFYTSENELFGDPRIELINRLEKEGVTIVAAAGNSYQFKDSNNGITNETQNAGSPSIFATLSVGAVWQDGNDPFGSFSNNQIPGADRVTFFSQRLNADNFILAPGALINSTYLDNGTRLLAGTSMASPHVAGAVALLQEAALEFGGRLLTTDEVVDILRSSADLVFDGDDENDNVANTGLSFPRLNIYNAVVELRRRFDLIAPPPPDFSADPNGTIAGAIIGPILNGQPVAPLFEIIGADGGDRSFVGDTDVDIYRFEVASSGTVVIELGTSVLEPNDFNTYLRLFDASGNEIASNDDIEFGVNTFSRIETDLAPGTYYAGVSGFNNNSYNPNVAGSGISGATGNYSLQLSLNNADPNGSVSGAQVINLGNDRKPLIFPDFIGADYGTPLEVSDVDLFRIAIPDDGILFIDIDTPYADGEFVNSFLRLFDEAGNELFFANNGEPFENDDGRSFDATGNFTEFPGDSGIVLETPNQTNLVNGFFDANNNYVKGNYGHSTDSFLGVRVEQGDVYHIGVSDFFNQDYDPTNLNNRPTAGNGGSYELIVTFANNDLNGSITQVTSTTNLPVINRQEVIGEDQNVIVGDRDIDFYRFRTQQAGLLEIDIDATEVDTVALIFDDNGQLLGVNDDNDGLNPLLRYQIAANTDYFVAITGYGNENFDPFGLATGAGGDTGAYSINANLLSLDQVKILSDNRIGNESVQNITIGDRVMGSIGEDNGLFLDASDVDLYRFVAPNDGIVNIRTITGQEFSADTYLRLFDSNGQEIAFNDNENSLTRGSLIRQTVTANSEYFIGVNGRSDFARAYNPVTGNNAAPGSQGIYSLSISNSSSDSFLNTPFSRFQNSNVPGTYLYATGAEAQNIRNNFPGFIEEGVAFNAAIKQSGELIPLFRFQSNQLPGTYLFVGETERNSINADPNFSSSFTEEGIAFYVYGVGANQGTAFSRFQNSNVPGTYLYATGTEADSIRANFPNFIDEGFAFEVAT